MMRSEQMIDALGFRNRLLVPFSVGSKVAELKTREYRLKFRREAACLYAEELDKLTMPAYFQVDAYYHFEDPVSMDGDRILYAISLAQGLKGYFVDTCFVYEDNISPEMADKLKWEYTSGSRL